MFGLLGSITHIWMDGKILQQHKWNNWRSNQLRELLNMGKTTPYIGPLMETGILPIREKIEYQTMMMYLSAIISDDKRLAKLVDNSTMNEVQHAEYFVHQGETNS